MLRRMVDRIDRGIESIIYESPLVTPNCQGLSTTLVLRGLCFLQQVWHLGHICFASGSTQYQGFLRYIVVQSSLVHRDAVTKWQKRTTQTAYKLWQDLIRLKTSCYKKYYFRTSLPSSLHRIVSPLEQCLCFKLGVISRRSGEAFESMASSELWTLESTQDMATILNKHMCKASTYNI